MIFFKKIFLCGFHSNILENVGMLFKGIGFLKNITKNDLIANNC